MQEQPDSLFVCLVITGVVGADLLFEKKVLAYC
jgi:hypothetical protein